MRRFLTCALVCLAPALAAAQGPSSFQIRLGGYFPAGGGEFWRDNRETFTLAKGDFYGGAFGLTYLQPLTDSLEFGVNFDLFHSAADAAYRGFVDDLGLPIFHETRLTLVPLMFDIRVVPGGREEVRGRRGRWRRLKVSPYLGGGLGMAYWKYQEEGEFISFIDSSIFYDRLQDQGWSPAAHIVGGLSIPAGRRFSLQFEGRYLWSKPELSDDFQGFGNIDLSGAGIYMGATFHL